MTSKDIKFREIRHLRGPNMWTYRPVLQAIVDIGDLEDCPSNTIPGYYERLKALTRGKAITRETMREFVQTLELPEAEKVRLLALTPASYVGLAAELAARVPGGAKAAEDATRTARRA